MIYRELTATHSDMQHNFNIWKLVLFLWTLDVVNKPTIDQHMDIMYAAKPVGALIDLISCRVLERDSESHVQF